MSARGATMKARGFTLIELMVSIALFGLIASGAMMLVMSGARMQAHSARVDVAQSALRAGLDFMTRDLLSASTGATTGNIMINGTSTLTISVTNSSTGPDQLDLYMGDSNYDFSTVYSNVTTASSTISVDRTSQFSAGQRAILTDLNNAVQITLSSIAAPSGVPPQGTLTVSGLSGGFATGVSGYSAGAAFVFALKHVRYSVGSCFGAADTIYANQSCLMMDLFDGPGGASNPQPLAEGVEDLQIALGFDNNGDGNLLDNGSTGDEWIGNNSGDSWPTTSLANLKVVRLTLVAISTMNENVVGAPYARPAAEDHGAATSNDGFFRRVIRTVVSVRNFNI